MADHVVPMMIAVQPPGADAPIMTPTAEGHEYLRALAAGQREWDPGLRLVLAAALAQLAYYRGVMDALEQWSSDPRPDPDHTLLSKMISEVNAAANNYSEFADELAELGLEPPE